MRVDSSRDAGEFVKPAADPNACIRKRRDACPRGEILHQIAPLLQPIAARHRWHFALGGNSIFLAQIAAFFVPENGISPAP
jgi:hypothetical protein